MISTENTTEVPVNYEKISQLSFEYKVYSIAVNAAQNLIVVCALSKIDIFDFQNGCLKHLQRIRDSNQPGYNKLIFMKKSNRFLFCNYTGQIETWAANLENHWYCQEITKREILGFLAGTETNLIISNDDQLLISESNQQVKFWTYQSEWKCQQVLSHHRDSIHSLSLNKSQNKLVSCSADMTLIIYQIQHGKWSKKQRIRVNEFGENVCFIRDNTIVFEPKCGSLQIFQYNSQCQLFLTYYQIEIPKYPIYSYYQLNPLAFNYQKSLLLIQRQNCVNIIKFRAGVRNDFTSFFIQFE